MHKGNTMLKAVSLLTAIVLWLYVMGEVDPETRAKIGDIPVSLTNTEVLADYGLAAAYDEQLMISATVSGKRSDVNEVKKNGLTAYVDVSECEKGTNEEKIVINLPSGVSLENSSQSTLKLDVENRDSKTVPVEISFAEGDAAGDAVNNTVPWVLDQYPEEMTVTGAESIVAKVKQVEGTIPQDLAVYNKSKWVDVVLEPVNGKGRTLYGIELDYDNAEAEIQRLTLKEADLELTIDEEDETTDFDKIDVEVPEKVRIVGTKKAIAEISKVEGTVTKDENGKINISVELPENIYLMIGENNGKIIWN